MSSIDKIDFLKIDDIILDIESATKNLDIIAQKIFQLSIDNKIKNEVSELLSNFENNLTILLRALKIIQYNNRKLFDQSTILENENLELKQKLKTLNVENNSMNNKNNQLASQINYQNNIITNQEKYIDELIEKLNNNEKIIYGINLTKKYDHRKLNLSSPEIENSSYNNNNSFLHNKTYIADSNYITQKLNYDYEKNIISNNDSKIINEEKNILPKNENYSDNIYNNIYNNNVNNKYNNNANDESEHNIKYVNASNYKFNDEFDKDENNSINNNESKNKINKVEKIISSIYKDNNLYNKLKEKYGNNIDSQIMNENVSLELLDNISKEIDEYYSKTITNKNLSEFSLRKNNFETFGDNKTKKGKIPKNVNINNKKKALKHKLLEDQEEKNKLGNLTNYFLFNLQRDKMINDKNRKKSLTKPKTPLH